MASFHFHGMRTSLKHLQRNPSLNFNGASKILRAKTQLRKIPEHDGRAIHLMTTKKNSSAVSVLFLVRGLPFFHATSLMWSGEFRTISLNYTGILRGVSVSDTSFSVRWAEVVINCPDVLYVLKIDRSMMAVAIHQACDSPPLWYLWEACISGKLLAEKLVDPNLWLLQFTNFKKPGNSTGQKNPN